MKELSKEELKLECGANWLEFAAGGAVGLATIAVDVFVPEVSPVVTRIGAAVAASLVVKGLTS
ncbi:hypothetical protein Alches_18530 [Alicyclobacillus hesperidum subsp. aegles]|uniref:hypothetical protein n=1 Tax=Alicyclobacillus hesperidum TaxID=89784 RepID=UPI0002E42953|nr:hypothetical protein [Alicyclobacillus hesperidum]KRW90656.1 hypothetical protein SD51_13500 [Alicyclobacillus tengchongensis]GLG01813.1 hypothetical protein Alches_18530 [Alicyclobacillus hesperidum subsp. aegles]